MATSINQMIYVICGLIPLPEEGGHCGDVIFGECLLAAFGEVLEIDGAGSSFAVGIYRYERDAAAGRIVELLAELALVREDYY